MISRKSFALMTVFAAMLCMAMFAGCGNQGSSDQATQQSNTKGFGDAYSNLDGAGLSSKQLSMDYDEDSDTLNMVIGGDESTLDQVFGILYDSTEGKHCGTLKTYIEWGWVENGTTPGNPIRQEMLSQLSSYIGSMPCASLQRLSAGRFIDDLAEEQLTDSSWTEILQKTDTLNTDWGYSPIELKYFTDGTQNNLDNVKRLEIVYRMNNPYKLEWSDYSKFSSDGKVLVDELKGIGIVLPGDDLKHDYLVYAYPTFELVGEYKSGTKAYSTTMHVQVYDLKKNVKYEPVVVKKVMPPKSRYLDNDEVHAPEVEDASIVTYVAGLT